MHDQTRQVAQQIMAYLEQNPHSMDTPEGIMRWWINDTFISLPKIDDALESLVKAGKVKRQTHADGKVYFSLLYQ